MINLIEYDARGATIQLGQRELLLLMALIQEGREAFGCNTDSGKALDEFFCTTNIKVEEARRKAVSRELMRQKLGTVTPASAGVRKDVSNG